MNCSPPGSSVHGILQARILVWVAIPSSRESPNPKIEPRSPALQADSLPSEPPGKPIYIKCKGLWYIVSLLQNIYCVCVHTCTHTHFLTWKLPSADKIDIKNYIVYVSGNTRKDTLPSPSIPLLEDKGLGLFLVADTRVGSKQIRVKEAFD